MRDWLGEDHPVWLVIEVASDHLDTSAAHAARRTGGRGAAGYDPDMLVALLTWAYAQGVTSSRRIERLCRTDVAFRVICGGGAGPDHVTIARFRAGLGSAAGGLFASMLVLCARLGMGQLGTVALDGTKIAAAASKSANRGEEHLRELARQRIAEHAAADAAEDELYGPGVRGDELPPELADPQTRAERIAAALAELEAERRAADRERGEQDARCQADLAARQERAARGLEQARQRAAGPGRTDGGTRAGPARNITDPHSRLMPVRGGGFVQGYNAQSVTTADGLIMATELTSDPGDVTWFEPMLRQAEAAAALITAARPDAPDTAPGAGPDGRHPIGLILADAGYLSEHNLTCAGPDRLIATGKRRDLEQAARDPAAGRTAARQATQAMAARLKTTDGISAYRHRGHIAETPHGHIKHNLRFRQLSVRGKPRATAEWALIATVHNLTKAITAGHLTHQALAALAT